MLCSLSAGKSSSNWLDRLRSSKGFPSGNDLDLEQFLNIQGADVPDSPGSKPFDPNANSIDISGSNRTHADKRDVLDCKLSGDCSARNGKRELLDRVGNVLAELFHIGDSNNFPRIRDKKCSRKQLNPRICVVSAAKDLPIGEGGSPTLPSSGDNSRVELKEAGDHVKEDGNVGEEEEDKSPHLDLSAFSRTEVTVIDTSCPSWKFDKLLFRRKNVWKVRDKKSKAMSAAKKKRKASLLEDGTAVAEKKAKLSALQCGSSKERNGNNGEAPSNNGLHHQSYRKKGSFKETADIFSQHHKKSSPLKLKMSGSSVVLIKSIPTRKKTGVNVHKNSPKLPHRQEKN